MLEYISFSVVDTAIAFANMFFKKKKKKEEKDIKIFLYASSC